MTDKAVPDALTEPESVTGILWHVTGMVLFASMDAVSKHLVVDLPVVEILWVRYVFFFLFGLALALRLEGWSAFKTKAPGLQIVRGLTLVAEIGLFTYAFRYLKLVDAHVMGAMTPLMVMALAIIVVQLPSQVALYPLPWQILYIMIIQMLTIPVTVE